jgi:hypothetical protein
MAALIITCKTLSVATIFAFLTDRMGTRTNATDPGSDHALI